MTAEFHAEENPSNGLLDEACALAPTNPFFSQAFVHAMAALGYRPWLLSLRNGSRLLAVGVGLMKSGRLNRSLEFTSLPVPDAPELFWERTVRFCRDLRVSYLEVNSFASTPQRIPALPGELARRARTEYLIDLRSLTPWSGLSSNHKRNVKLAEKAGLQVRSQSDAQACHDHLRLVRASLDRRRARGETVADGGDAETLMAYARSGLAEWFQAVKAGEVHSSILVLKAARGAYYQSAGTSPEGMAQGASPFLICQTAAALRDRGMDVFNLGGADEHDAGLQRFKAGFGAASVELQATRLYLGSALKRKLTTAAALLRSESLSFRKQLGGLGRGTPSAY